MKIKHIAFAEGKNIAKDVVRHPFFYKKIDDKVINLSCPIRDCGLKPQSTISTERMMTKSSIFRYSLGAKAAPVGADRC
ncbi:MAG: hypothetical protein IJB24_05290 [Clostridia bacterium]|nr:hypothetical protein [Clostridia bacterium]